MGSETEEQMLLKQADSKRFLNFFERIRIDFPGQEDLYPSVDWVKAKSGTEGSFDCLEICR